MTKLDLQSFTNPNLLEYNYDLVEQYYKTYYVVSEVGFTRKDSFIQLICDNVIRNYKTKDAKNIINRNTKRFINCYNAAVLAVDKAKIDNQLNKYKKIAIRKKNNRTRIVYDPSPEFKDVLKKFLEVLEFVCFDKYHPKYKHFKVSKDTGRVAQYTRHSKTYKLTSAKQICPHKRSIDNLLADLSICIKNRTEIGSAYYVGDNQKLGLCKLDIKDAFQSTTYPVVKTYLEMRLRRYPKLREFVIDNLEMCFINGKLPPGYPTSNILFHFIKDIILSKFKDNRFALIKIFSYVDDIYVLYYDNNLNKDLLLSRFKKYLRRWGYRVNKNKTRNLIATDSKGKLTSKFQAVNILGKYPKPGQQHHIRWSGSKKHKNKARMLAYILEKEKLNLGSASDPNKQTEAILKQKLDSFQNFYFARVGSLTYRAMQTQ